MSPVIAFARGLQEHPPLPELKYGWLEAPLAARLSFLCDLPDWRDPRCWPAGRVFGNAGEYRWRTAGDGGLHAVLLLDSGEWPPSLGEPVELQQTAEEALILWGEWVRPDDDPQGNAAGGPRFYANEIPGYLDYPLELAEAPKDGATARLIVRTYRDRGGLRGEFMRCVRLELWKPEDQDG